MSKVSGSAQKALKATGAIAGAVATTTAAMVKATADGIKNAATYGDNVDKMSQKMGMSAAAFQEWDFVMQHNGTTIEGLQAAMKTMATQAETNGEAFQKLGITEEQIANMSQEELFSATITALQGIEDETERTYLAGKTLGRGATELGALLNMSAEDTEEMKKQAHDLGGVMSDESVKAAAAFQDALQNLQTSMSGITRGAMGQFLPDITKIMEGLTALFNGDESGLAMITEGIDDFINHFSDVMPKLLEVGQQIIISLLNSLTENAPKLMEAAIPIIIKLADGIIQNLPQLLESAAQIIIKIAEGIVAALPELMPTILEVIIQIAAALVKMAPQLLVAAAEIMVQLAKGLIKFIGTVLGAIPEIISKIRDKFTNTDWKEVGRNIITGIKNGIVGMASDLYNTVKETAQNVLGKFKDVLGIHSPSKEFQKLADMCVLGFERPLEEMDMDGATKGVQASLGTMQASIAGANYSTSGSFMGNINSNVQVVLEGDAAGVFRLVKQETRKTAKSLGYNPLMA